MFFEKYVFLKKIRVFEKNTFFKMLGFKTICILKLYTVLKMYTGFEHLIHLKNFYKVFEKMYTVFENDITVSGTPRSVHTHTHCVVLKMTSLRGVHAERVDLSPKTRGVVNCMTDFAWGPRVVRGKCTQSSGISLLWF